MQKLVLLSLPFGIHVHLKHAHRSGTAPNVSPGDESLQQLQGSQQHTARCWQQLGMEKAEAEAALQTAQLQLELAQQALLAAERDEFVATATTEREELVVQRMKSRIATMLSDGERLQFAEASAQAELARGQAARSSSGHWVMPGEHIVGNPR